MICFDFFCAGLRLVLISPLRDVFNLHSQRTVQYSEQKIRPVQTNEILDFFYAINLIKQKEAILEKSKCLYIHSLCYKKSRF